MGFARGGTILLSVCFYQFSMKSHDTSAISLPWAQLAKGRRDGRIWSRGSRNLTCPFFFTVTWSRKKVLFWGFRSAFSPGKEKPRNSECHIRRCAKFGHITRLVVRKIVAICGLATRLIRLRLLGCYRGSGDK